MGLNRCYNVFFAIPWDAATKSMYDTIKDDLEHSRFKNDFHFHLGTTSVGQPQPDFSKIDQFKIEEFKAQNQDFLTRFVHVIEATDIIIADLTNNNASVHIELGIALTLNKNILRVSGRNLIDAATDLRGYEVNQYTCRQQLYDWISSYLAYFLKIKRTLPTLVIPTWQDGGLNITGLNAQDAKKALQQTTTRIFPLGQVNGRTRDSEIALHFKFIETYDDSDWFAILLRNETANPWLGSGYFVFARLGGALEIHEVPTGDPPLEKKDYPHLGKNTDHVLRVDIDGNHLSASLDEELESGIHVDSLEHQSPGSAFLCCYRSSVKFGTVEFAQRDAIAFR